MHEIAVLGYRAPELEIRVRCSRGTYVRSLARDLALHAGSCARLQSLRRTAIGPLQAEDAVAPAEFTPARDLREPGELLRSRRLLPLRVLGEEERRRILSGRGIGAESGEEGRSGAVALLDAGGRLVAIGAAEGGVIRPATVFGGGH